MQLFTEYFSNNGNRTDKIHLRFFEEGFSRELEHLCTAVDELMFLESNSKGMPLRTKSLKGAIPDSENKYDKIQNAARKNEIALCSGNFGTDIKAYSKEFITPYLRNLIVKEKYNILILFHEREHMVILKVIQQLRQLHQLLEGKEEWDLTLSLAITNDGNKEQSEKEDENSNSLLAHAKAAIRLHANPIFLLICFCRSVHFITFVPAVTIIVDFCMDKGILEEDGKYVIAALSFGDLIGRLCLGWVTDKEYIGLPRYMLFTMIIQGACTASLSLMYSKATLLFLIMLFGLLHGSLFVRHPVLVSKYLGKNEQSVAMGCFNFFSGLLGFALPCYIGYFRDTIGSYDCMFYINGGIGTFVGIMWFFLTLLPKMREIQMNI